MREIRQRIIYLGVAALLFAVGAAVLVWLWRWQDAHVRDKMLQHAILVAAALDPRQFDELSFAGQDAEHPAFRAVAERMRNLRAVFGRSWAFGDRYIGIYSMRMRGDTVLFGPESIPPEDPRASPPGTEYLHPPEEVYCAFAEGRWQVVGPYTDEYSTFVSAFVPILDPESGRVVAVLGMDVEASDWKRVIAARAALPAALVVLALVSLLMVHLRGVAARRLRRREEEYRLLTEHAVAGVAVHEMVFDGSGKAADYVFLYVNQAFERQTGLSAADVLGRHASKVLPGIEGTELIERYGNVVRSGEPATFETYSPQLRRHHVVSAYRVAPNRFAAVFTDITDRKRLEEEDREIRGRLESAVRTLETQRMRDQVVAELQQFLQACETVREAGPVIEREVQRLLPASSGALYLMSSSRNDLKLAACWGPCAEQMRDEILLSDECWGLRRGQPYFVEDPGRSVPCPHAERHGSGSHACLPLIAKGVVLGLLHLREPADRSAVPQALSQIREVGPAIAEMLSLALSNIQLRETLHNQSVKDPLTGLFNRRYLEETFPREVARARRAKHPIGIVMADIDHFKLFNDVHGHAAGDAVLAVTAQLLASSLRGSDIVCRYGGEEFVLVLPEASVENTRRRAEQLLEKVRTRRIPFGGGWLGPITLSMGVAGCPVHGAQLDEILRVADLALYEAKRSGRNRVVEGKSGTASAEPG